MALRKKVNVYDSFIEGAKDGFGVAIKIIPYLVAIIVSIGVFRASGSMDLLISGIGWLFSFIFSDIAFVDGLPTALMKPLSGSGARGLMLESFSHHGVDSFVGKLTSTLQGATDTTFYIIAVYFGSVGIRNTRYAVKAGLLADFAGIVAGIIVAYMFFGGAITGLTNKQTVEQFTSYMSAGDVKHAKEYLDDNIVICNNSFDTVCVDKNGALSKFFISANTTASLIEELDEDNKPLLIKTNKEVGSEIENRNYKATVKNGKITSIEILTYFENQSTY